MSNRSAGVYRDPLEDRGWQQMKVLLDREMPEKKRRLFWWHWAGIAAGIILLAFSISSVFLMPKNKPALVDQQSPGQKVEAPENKVMKPKEEVINRNAISGTTDTGIDLKNKQDIIEKSIDKTAPESTELFKAKLANTENKNPVKLSDQKQINPDFADIIKSDQYSPNNKEEKPALPEPVQQTGQIVEGGVDLPEDEIEHEKLSPIEQLHFNTEFFGPTGIRTTQNNPANQEMKPPVIARYRKKIDLAIAISGLTEPQFQKWSSDAGVKVRYKPFTKIAVGTGLYYWGIAARQEFISQQPNQGFSANSADSDNMIPEAMDTLGAFYNAVSVAMVDKLRYLRVPLFVQFFPGSTWQPHIGLNQLVLISDSPSTSSQERMVDFVNSPNISLTMVDNFVRKSYISYSIGLTYQPFDHFYLDMSYSHGQKSYLNYSVTQGDLYRLEQQLRLAVGFRF